MYDVSWPVPRVVAVAFPPAVWLMGPVAGSGMWITSSCWSKNDGGALPGVSQSARSPFCQEGPVVSSLWPNNLHNLVIITFHFHNRVEQNIRVTTTMLYGDRGGDEGDG